MQKFTKNPNTCDCQGFTYADNVSKIWPVIIKDEAYIFTGHHPSCEYWFEPPCQITGSGLKGVSIQDTEKIIVELARMIHELK